MTFCGISWPVCSLMWDDIIDELKNIPGIGTAEHRIVNCSQLNDDEWFIFVKNCYLSHEKIDLPNADLGRIERNLKIKFEQEGFLYNDNLFLFVEFNVEDEQRVIDYICGQLREKWGFDDERIRVNRESNERQNCSYVLNIIKDYVRRTFRNDLRLPTYYKGVEKGRKRVFHSPASDRGCTALKLFLDEVEIMELVNINNIQGIDVFKNLNFPTDKYAIMNSSWQAALGIRKNGDVDVLVSEDFYDEAVKIAEGKNPPVSIMKEVYWDWASATGMNKASDIIKNHSVVVQGVRMISFDAYVKMMNVRRNSNTRFKEPAKRDLAAVDKFMSLDGLPVLK